MNITVEGQVVGLLTQLNILLLKQNKSCLHPKPKQSIDKPLPGWNHKLPPPRELELGWILRLLFEVGKIYFSIPGVQGLAISHTC